MLHFDAALCTGCGLCARHCYSNYLTMGEQFPILPEGACLACGHCAAICPAKAITVEGNGYNTADVLEYDRDSMHMDAGQLLRLMQYRRSIRRYTSAPVPHDLLTQVLEAGRYSPTIGNFQTVRYIVLEQQKMHYVRLAAAALWCGKQQQHPETDLFQASLLERIYQESCAGRDKLFHGAPAVILILDREHYGNQANAYIAASRIELMAQSLGLGTCYCGLFLRAAKIDPAVTEVLQIPEGYQVHTVLTIGYPEDVYLRTVSRKPVQVEWK